jgi:hypothetical protein
MSSYKHNQLVDWLLLNFLGVLKFEQMVNQFDQPNKTIVNFIVPPINWSTKSFCNPKWLINLYNTSNISLVF